MFQNPKRSLWAAKDNQWGRMRPTGRQFDMPGLQHRVLQQTLCAWYICDLRQWVGEIIPMSILPTCLHTAFMCTNALALNYYFIMYSYNTRTARYYREWPAMPVYGHWLWEFIMCLNEFKLIQNPLSQTLKILYFSSEFIWVPNSFLMKSDKECNNVVHE